MRVKGVNIKVISGLILYPNLTQFCTGLGRSGYEIISGDNQGRWDGCTSDPSLHQLSVVDAKDQAPGF